MSTENDSAPAAPADPAEMTQASSAALVQADEPAPAEASTAHAGEGADSVPAAEGAHRDEAAQVTQVDQGADGAALTLEATAPGPEEAAAAAPTKTELSPAQCAARLAEMFPALFSTQGPPKPIKLRIQADIQQRAPGLFTRKALSIVLHRHTTTTPYLKALLAAPSRFDLDGQPAGEIAEEHRQAAREEVERRRAIVAARRAAEGQARHPREPRGARPPHSPSVDGTPGEGHAAAPDQAAALESRDPGAPGTQQRQATQPHARPSRDRGHREGTGSPGGRPPRGPQPFREPRDGHAPQAAREPREPREPRPPRPDGSSADRPGRQGFGPRGAPQRDGRPPHQNARQGTRQGTRFEARHEASRPRPQAEPQEHPALAEDPARRERALLLRTYEASSLTKANFCVLKRITEAELDAQLALARQERGPARPRP